MSDNEKFLINGTTLVRFKGNTGKISEVKVPEDVDQIAANAFFACRVKKIILPEGLYSIGSDAFNFCKDLKKLNLPSTIKFIGKRAFMECEKLTTLLFPKGLKSLGDEACKQCASLRLVILSKETKVSKTAFDHCSPNLLIDYYEG